MAARRRVKDVDFDEDDFEDDDYEEEGQGTVSAEDEGSLSAR